MAAEAEDAETKPEKGSSIMLEKPKTFEDAKKFAAAPAGSELEKYPPKFVRPELLAARAIRPDAGRTGRSAQNRWPPGSEYAYLTCRPIFNS